MLSKTGVSELVDIVGSLLELPRGLRRCCCGCRRVRRKWSARTGGGVAGRDGGSKQIRSHDRIASWIEAERRACVSAECVSSCAYVPCMTCACLVPRSSARSEPPTASCRPHACSGRMGPPELFPMSVCAHVMWPAEERCRSSSRQASQLAAAGARPCDAPVAPGACKRYSRASRDARERRLTCRGAAEIWKCAADMGFLRQRL